LHALWQEPGRGDEYVGTLVNAWLARGGTARGVRAGERYVDVGTMHGWREAVALLDARPPEAPLPLPFRALQQNGMLRPRPDHLPPSGPAPAPEGGAWT